MDFTRKKTYNVQEVIQMLEDDDDENLLDIDVTIVPPTNLNGDTDEDSGKECSNEKNLNHLNSNQLFAEASVRLHKTSGDVVLGLNDNLDDFIFESGETCLPSTSSDKPRTIIKKSNEKIITGQRQSERKHSIKKLESSKKSKEKENLFEVERQEQATKVTTEPDYQPSWKKHDLKESVRKVKFAWNIPPPSLNTNSSPVTLFELFFTPDLMRHICDESNFYAAQKGILNFDLDIPTLKLFFSILLLSGYSIVIILAVLTDLQCDGFKSSIE
ncbi:hypothetical protein HELRODRAFT_179129 [Helobdella robusta]|uniref:PiggyBac transposable element-derived protein domain-containing protein n=1 Tax=Helobdella robusta TaxID=6412 RepID=T1FE77_HELRO|nr:hypothetical protein HELRODRAFT_179129 [Helobdella robusta]ESN95659.1 hypothetical protein HELRODRAFT_179129 [Helobdella robusta]